MNATPKWNDELGNSATTNPTGQPSGQRHEMNENSESSSSDAASEVSTSSERSSNELRHTRSDANMVEEVDGDDYYLATNEGVFPLPMAVTAGHHLHQRAETAQWTTTSINRDRQQPRPYFLSSETRTRTTTRTSRKRRLRPTRRLTDANEPTSDFRHRQSAEEVTCRGATRRSGAGHPSGANPTGSPDFDDDGGGDKGNDMDGNLHYDDHIPASPFGKAVGNDAASRHSEDLKGGRLDRTRSGSIRHKRGAGLSPLSESRHFGASNSGKFRSSGAKMAAIYYGECYEKGIPIKYADEAVDQSHSAYVKWWQQNFPEDHPIDRRQTEDSIDLRKRPAPASSHSPSQVSPSAAHVSEAKTNLLRVLAVSCGDIQSADCKSALETLCHLQNAASQGKSDETTRALQSDWKKPSNALEGTWILLSKPVFPQNLGSSNSSSSSSTSAICYTLGRMSFDMLQPSDLVCPIHGVYNSIQIVDPADTLEMDKVPILVQHEMAKQGGKTILRTYNIISAFSIETHDTTSLEDQTIAKNPAIRPIQGIMTTFGYALPDPQVQNRLSVWFTGGMIEVNDEIEDGSEWERIFERQQDSSGDDEDDDEEEEGKVGESVRTATAAPHLKHPSKIRKKNSKQSLRVQANAIAAKLLLGASPPEELHKGDMSMSYKLSNPIGGHNNAFVDVMYADENLRVMKGHHGTIFVFARQQDAQAISASDPYSDGTGAH